MSDNLAAATLAAAALSRMKLDDDADVAKETVRLFRRFRGVIERVDQPPKKGLTEMLDAEDV